MNWPLFLSAFFLLSASADSTIKVETLPELKYLFRDLNIVTKTPEEVRSAELRTHDAIEEMHAEGKALKLKTNRVPFTVFDLREVKVREACLEVTGSGLNGVPKGKVRTRPAGEYLVLRFRGNVKDLTFSEVEDYLKKNKLKLKEEITYQHKKSVLPLENNLSVFIFPLEQKK